MKKLVLSIAVVLSGLFIQACTDHEQPFPEPTTFTSQPFVEGLKAPIGMAIDDNGNMWVTEAGTGNGTDGSVSMITPSGTKTLYVTGLSSITQEGSPEGIGHLVFQGGKLYFLHGSTGKLYIADVASFKSGDAAVNLASIPVEDIGTFVKSKALTDPLNSNTWDLTVGPDGLLYIADSGANAIFKRDSDGTLHLFAQIPNVATKVEAVPTGIVYDGTKFLVSTLTGFPFAKDNAKIFQVDKNGKVDVYAPNFTTLTGITLSANNKPIVVHHGEFGAMGFKPNSGEVLDEKGNVLLKNISRPTDIIRTNDDVYYLLSYQDGTIVKLTY
jgi:glucose/arabinose dehydrogenase